MTRGVEDLEGGTNFWSILVFDWSRESNPPPRLINYDRSLKDRSSKVSFSIKTVGATPSSHAFCLCVLLMQCISGVDHLQQTSPEISFLGSLEDMTTGD